MREFNAVFGALYISDNFVDIVYICYCYIFELCTGSQTEKLISGLDIPATQFNWPLTLLYCVLSVSVSELLRSDILSFGSEISDIDAM